MIQFYVGLGCVLVGIAAAIYFNKPPQHGPQSGRRPITHNQHNGNVTSYNRDTNTRTVPRSKPGDKCILCLTDMKANTMHIMRCGHALCSTICVTNYKQWRRECPYCEKIVFHFTKPGDECVICNEVLEEEEIKYLKCEHALHKACLRDYLKNNFKTCPICKSSM